ncbi:acyltransferase [Actinoplanes sp. N902-109]|uniref:acyltransferase family protein n=1 Tax=Actinoplanes sp. (strain N902-109) TaxID=649831 RepID=UPI0003295A13|nr:acyltransferase [Actinoplanes sp. N902-109]AGL16709.1 acyltransferase-like protein [Actinoplanes sp. N902-109]
MSTTEKRRRDPAVYGIRGWAALALTTVHVAMFSGLLGTRAFGEHRPPSNAVGGFLVSGMPSFIGVFFVLPALYLYLPLARAVIAGTPGPPQGPAMVRRLVRLLPAYWLMYAVVLVALNRQDVHGLWEVLRPVLLLQIYSPTPFAPHFINGMEVSWTVPSMVQWYLALPLIAWAMRPFAARGATPAARARRLLLPVPVLVAIGVAWLAVVKLNGWDNRMVFWWPQGFAPTIGIGMGLAVLIALARVAPADTSRLLRVAAARPAWCWLAALAVYLVNCARPFSVIGMDAIYSVSGLLVTYAMVALFGLFASLPLVAPGARETRFTRLALANPVMAHLGKVSYGVYLWHFAVMHFVLQPGNVLGGQARPIRELYGLSGFWRLELATVAGAVLLATISHRFVEEPLARRIDRLPGMRRTAPPPAAGQQQRTSLPQRAAEPSAEGRRRDTVRANLVDLENHPGRRLLDETGTPAHDLTQLWALFHAYSTAVDRATAVVVVTGPPAPLGQRHITDDGREELTVDAVLARMDELFRRTARLVLAAAPAPGSDDERTTA